LQAQPVAESFTDSAKSATWRLHGFGGNGRWKETN
jgi:hypothetical protein